MEVRVGEARESERRKASLFDRDPELLIEFPDEGLLRPFINFNLATRKFPKTWEGFSFWTLRDQYATIRVYQSDGGDEQ